MSRTQKTSEPRSAVTGAPGRTGSAPRGRRAVPPPSGIPFVDASRSGGASVERTSQMFLQRACKCAAASPPCEACGARQLVQRAAKAAPASGAQAGVASARSASGGVASVIASGGQALAPAVRQSMERSFGRDLGSVRIHTGPEAAASAEALGARAYTVGDHIVFNRDEHQPHTRRGKHLLAHELAHTVQQAGLQRAATDVALTPAREAHLEAEADRAADAVIAGRSPAPIGRVGGVGPLLQRAAKDDASAPAAAAPTSSRVWEAAPSDAASIAKKATAVFKLGGKHAQAFLMQAPFPLPDEKGASARALWEARASAHALETVWERGGKVELAQARDKTADLKTSWLQKVGWPQDAAKANANWKSVRKQIVGAAPKDDTNEADFKPRVAGDGGKARTCHMDHVVELQMQGTNVASNIAVLDGSENSASGSQIAAYIRSVATQLEDAVPGVDIFVLSFDAIAKANAPANGFCTQIEDLIASGKAKITEAAAPTDAEIYPLSAGGSVENAFVKKGGTEDDLSTGTVANLIPGLTLKTLDRKSSAKHKVAAGFAEEGQARIPITLEGEAKKKGAILLDVGPKGTLALHQGGNVGLRFHYPYLSTGKITKLELLENKGIAGEGELIPSIPLLKHLKLRVVFAPNRLEVITELKNPKLDLPIPGFKVTRADLSLLLHPKLEPTGTFEFTGGRGSKKLVEGKVAVGADAEGFYAKGSLRALLPGVDDATGTFLYRRTGWQADVHVGASDIKLPLPGMKVKEGAVDAHLDDKGIRAAGKVVIGLPGNQEAELGLDYVNERWLFRGIGRFNVPPLKTFEAKVTYDGKKIVASGATTMSYRGFDASIDVRYVDGKVHGKGRLDFRKGRVHGSADVEVDDQLRISGAGNVTVKINESLEASAGIELTKKGGVHLKGALALTKPIVLFQGYSGAFNLFALKKTLPIPGLSIGPLGVQGVLGASLDARYSIGPAALVDTTLTLALDPFDDKPDPDIGLKSRLSLPASAGITATITGGLELEAGLARAGGEIAVSGGANVTANAGADLAMRYHQKQLEVKGAAVLDAALVLRLGVNATVYGEVGVWKFKNRWAKSWQLYDKTFDTGLKLKLKAPFGYTTAGGAKLPTANDIEIVKPTLSIGPMVDSLVGQARQEEKEKK